MAIDGKNLTRYKSALRHSAKVAKQAVCTANMQPSCHIKSKSQIIRTLWAPEFIITRLYNIHPNTFWLHAASGDVRRTPNAPNTPCWENYESGWFLAKYRFKWCILKQKTERLHAHTTDQSICIFCGNQCIKCFWFSGIEILRKRFLFFSFIFPLAVFGVCDFMTRSKIFFIMKIIIISIFKSLEWRSTT